jgi:hypothetical protein
MTSTIEFTLSSPCPAHRDAILSWIVEGSDSPAAAAAAEHVKKCVACREFRDSLKMQRALVSKAAASHGFSPEIRLSNAIPDFSDWIEIQLRRKGDRALAHQLWRIATQLLKAEVSVARAIFTEDAEGCIAQENKPLRLEKAREQLLAHSSHSGIKPSLFSEYDGLLRQALDATLSSSRFPPEARVRLIRSIAQVGAQLSGDVQGLMDSVVANVEWYYGSTEMVPPLLECALDHARTSAQRAHAIANLAVWKSSLKQFAEAIHIGEMAVENCEALSFPRMNLVVWLMAEGRAIDAAWHLESVSRQIGTLSLRQHWPFGLLDEWLMCGLVGMGASHQERKEASRELWKLYRESVGGLTQVEQSHDE